MSFKYKLSETVIKYLMKELKKNSLLDLAEEH